MVPIHCVNHGGLVLLPYSHIRVENTAGGIVVHYRCTCGHEGAEPMHPAAPATASPSAA